MPNRKNDDLKSYLSKDLTMYVDVEQPNLRQFRSTRLAVCSANNTHITIVLYVNGQTFKMNKSTGMLGFKGTKRGTPHAAEQLAVVMSNHLLNQGVKRCDVVLSGMGRGRSVIVKGVVSTGIEVVTISEASGEPHNGCRRKKARRV